MTGYIYKITNDKTDKFYIGSTLNPEMREERHFDDLKANRHHSIYLQRAYNKYGRENFHFTIVKEREFSSEEELRLLEERYINFCWNTGKLYNVSKKGSGGDLVSYHPLLEEIKKKQRIATKKKWDSKTEEEKQAYSEKLRGRGNPNFGNKWTDEQREKASKEKKEYFKTHDNYIKGKTFEEAYGIERAIKIKQKLSASFSKRTGEKNSFYGRHHSEETKRKLSEQRKGKIPADAKKVLYNGVVYDSAMECSRKTGINHLTICYRCRQHIYGFSYVGEGGKERIASKRWNLEDCEAIAKTCKTKKEFEQKNPSAYQWANRNGCIKEFSEKYFIELRHRWTLDEVLELARKYSSYSEFWNSEKKAVATMNRNKWTETIKAIFECKKKKEG